MIDTILVPGNLVRHDGKDLVVLAIETKEIILKWRGCECPVQRSDIYGIRLTDTLLDYMFEECKYIGNQWCIPVTEYDNIVIRKDQYGNYFSPLFPKTNVIVNYVHELQNLYHVITGKQLKTIINY